MDRLRHTITEIWFFRAVLSVAIFVAGCWIAGHEVATIARTPLGDTLHDTWVACMFLGPLWILSGEYLERSRGNLRWGRSLQLGGDIANLMVLTTFVVACIIDRSAPFPAILIGALALYVAAWIALHSAPRAFGR